MDNLSVAMHQQPHHHSPQYTLQWRQNRLLVTLSQNVKQPHLAALKNKQWLIDCLKRSPVKLVSLDPKIGEKQLSYWADASAQAGKKAFLWITSNPELHKKRPSLTWYTKRILDWNVAALLLIILSPVILALALLIRISSPGPIFFRQWCVGKGGKLFQMIKFRTRVVDAETQNHDVMDDLSKLHKRADDLCVTPLGYWMRKYSLDELSQLINVVRGEMSLVGARPWTLYDAVRLRPEEQRLLNTQPVMIGLWRIKTKVNRLDIETAAY